MPEVFESIPEPNYFIGVRKRTLDFLRPAGDRQSGMDLRITYNTVSGDVEDSIQCSTCDNRNHYTATETWRNFWAEWSVGGRAARLNPPLNQADLRRRLEELPPPTHIDVSSSAQPIPHFAAIYIPPLCAMASPATKVPTKPRSSKTPTLNNAGGKTV